ncbi:MAG: GIDE domain-containing protein [Candidatus Aenigmarchaeota archaeon]|nr:GIDE domain-containing protein [Candidatus Aenigmarchaeota archaeon]
MAEGDIFFAAIFGLGFGIFSFIMGLKKLFLKRMIENIPTSKARSVAMGLVEVYGEVVSIKTLKSPFSGKECVYYKYQIEELRSSGKSSHWATIRKEERCEPFRLRDETGEILVDCTGANVDIKLDNRFESGIGHKPPNQVYDFLDRNGIAYKGLLGIGKHMRYTEWFIEPKEKVYVMGTASDNPNVKLTAKGMENVIIRKGQNEGTFYVSDKSEKEILSSLGWKVMLGVFGGAALAVGCLAFILFYMRYPF